MLILENLMWRLLFGVEGDIWPVCTGRHISQHFAQQGVMFAFWCFHGVPSAGDVAVILVAFMKDSKEAGCMRVF